VIGPIQWKNGKFPFPRWFLMGDPISYPTFFPYFMLSYK
jgi:hypothetical protein